MGKFLRQLASAAFIFSLAISAAGCGGPADQSSTEAAAARPVTWAIQGFNYPSWWHDDYLSGEAAAALDGMAATGANWVAVVPTQYMDRAASDTIAPETAGRSASEASVEQAIIGAHTRGLKVMLKPHVDVRDGTWRGEIRPDDPAAWFASYRNMIIGYARLAERQGVEMLCVGTELASMADPAYNDEWAALIVEIRLVYSGDLTYGADMSSYGNITFWPLLDYLGLSFYYPLSDAAEPSVEELVAGWSAYSGILSEDDGNWLARVEAWQGRWQKPVIFTEIGYRSIDHAARQPWDYEYSGSYNGDAQAMAYTAAFEVLRDKPWFAGMFWWNWGTRADSCGPGNTDYTICGKPAEDVVTEAFSGGDGFRDS